MRECSHDTRPRVYGNVREETFAEVRDVDNLLVAAIEKPGGFKSPIYYRQVFALER